MRMTIELDNIIKSCNKCELYKTMPFSPVCGVGPKNASIMIVGEAPGQDESMAEEPFVGQCGRLLDRLLSEAGINRHEVYITNTVKCRPFEGKKNRPPSRCEIKSCHDWLFQEIDLIQPRLIFTLGKIPTYTLLSLKPTFKLGDYVGKVSKYNGIDVIPQWHPSWLLQYGKKQLDLAREIFRLGLNYI